MSPSVNPLSLQGDRAGRRGFVVLVRIWNNITSIPLEPGSSGLPDPGPQGRLYTPTVVGEKTEAGFCET